MTSKGGNVTLSMKNVKVTYHDNPEMKMS